MHTASAAILHASLWFRSSFSRSEKISQEGSRTAHHYAQKGHGTNGIYSALEGIYIFLDHISAAKKQVVVNKSLVACASRARERDLVSAVEHFDKRRPSPPASRKLAVDLRCPVDPGRNPGQC
jgi:hypothetical protein